MMWEKNVLNKFHFYMDETALKKTLAIFNVSMCAASLSKPQKSLCRIEILWRLFFMV